MRSRVLLVVCAALFAAQAATAATFVVPTDDELIAKSNAIVIGTVEGSFAREANGVIETVYEIRLERAVKGVARANELIRVVEPGGEIGDRGVIVPGAAEYRQGERVLAFLTRGTGAAEWRTVDLTLGKFAFRTSTRGDRVLVRDMEDVVGWDHAGQVHREQVRLEKEFLTYLGERVRGRQAQVNYVVDASTVTLEPRQRLQTNAIGTNAAPFPAETYVSWVSSTPPRWPNISAGVTFYKRTDTNIPGASDGGVSVIQNGLAAWNNECASNINLIYGGQRQTASANHDGVNVVEFNDPQQRIGGSWTGSGTVGITFISFSGNHTFNGRSWLNITGADVVFQDGYPATNASFASAMTHELGHGIGWRHSNQDYLTKGACNSAVEECTSAAIMNSSVSANYGYTLQPFDIHAAESVYPGGTCGPACTPVSITAHPTSRTIPSGSSTTLTVSASGTGPLSYQWYRGTSPSTANPISGATSSSLTVSPTSTTSYWVRVTNSCGTANSNTATVTVTTPPPPPAGRARGDYNGDGRTDPAVFRPSTGQWWIYNIGIIQWGQNGDQPVPGHYNSDDVTDVAVFRAGTWYIRNVATIQFGAAGDTAVPADFTGDGVDDVAVFRPSTGQWFISGIGTIQWGQNGDQPVPADYNGDGNADVAVFRPSTGTYYIRNVGTVKWGQSGDRAVPADYSGDGRDDIAVFRPSTGQWFISGVGTFQWGQNGDQPVPGDYNGDGNYDVAVYRPSATTWYVRNVYTVQWGEAGDIPLFR
jgi:Dual-action HEIGH metallo-peptidase